MPPNHHTEEGPASRDGYRGAYAAARSELVRLRAERTELAFRCERLEAAMAAASDGVWDFDILKERVHYSAGWARMLGYEPGELGDGMEQAVDLLHPEDRPRVEALFARHVAGACDDAYRVEFRLRHRAGHWVSVFSRGEVVRDHEGRAVRFIGTHVDLSTCVRTRDAEFPADPPADPAEKAPPERIASEAA